MGRRYSFDSITVDFCSFSRKLTDLHLQFAYPVDVNHNEVFIPGGPNIEKTCLLPISSTYRARGVRLNRGYDPHESEISIRC